MIDATIYPSHHVAHEWMMEDRDGNLWVRRTKPDRTRWQMTFTPVDDTPTGWDVFDPRGVWLGVVELPARFRVMDIGPDYVAGVWKDELEVEFVRIYALSKPTGEEDGL